MPEANLLGERGAGFAIAQDRLGPGRIHHCMRAIGAAERALRADVQARATSARRSAGTLAEKQFVQDFIAKSRIEIDAARLMVLHAAWKMDTEGKREARQEISMIKVVAANMLMDVLDRAMQVHGALGVSDDTPLAMMWRQGALAAPRRRPGRGAQDGDRPARAEPLQAARAGRGLVDRRRGLSQPADHGLTRRAAGLRRGAARLRARECSPEKLAA